MIYFLSSMNIFRSFFLLLIILCSWGAGLALSYPSGDDPSINDVQEFNVDGIDVLLRESKETPVVTSILFLKGGTSYMTESELPATEYFALSLIPASGTQF